MEKIKLNTQVVSMRKYVKQAKTHIINKSVKQAKLLQQKKGTEQKCEKYKRKNERLLEAISLLKKISPDLVSKKALAKEKDWKSVLKEKKISLEDRCFAMLSSHDLVQKEVERFHSENSALVPKIPELLQQWEERKKELENTPKPSIKASDIKKKFKERSKFNAKRLPPLSSNRTPLGGKGSALTQNCGSSALKHRHSSHTSNAIKLEKETSLKDQKETFGHDAVDEGELKNYERNYAAAKTVEKHGSGADDSPAHQSDDSDADSEEDDDVSDAVERENENEDSGDSDLTDTEDDKNSVSGSEKGDDIEDSKSTVRNASKNLKRSEKNASKNFYKSPEKRLSSDVMDSKSKLKAIKVINMDEMQNMDSIPMDESSDENEDAEDAENSQKRQKDSFFMGRGRASDSENSDSEIADNSKESSEQVHKFKRSSGRGRQNLGENTFRDRKFRGRGMSHSRGRGIRGKPNFKQFGSRRDFGDMKSRTNFRERFSHFKDDYVPKKWSGSPRDKDFSNSKNLKFRHKNGFSTSGSEFQTQKSVKASNRKDGPDTFGKNSSIGKKPSIIKKDHESGPLHPSWEAKRKMKEALTTQPKGKRIVFD